MCMLSYSIYPVNTQNDTNEQTFGPNHPPSPIPQSAIRNPNSRLFAKVTHLCYPFLSTQEVV